ncbi:MAG: ABC transporter substrate-binding protein [Cyanobium sp.]
MNRRHLFSLALASTALSACKPLARWSVLRDDNELRIWWDAGHYPEQRDAMSQIVNAWQRDTGVRVHVDFKRSGELEQYISLAESNRLRPGLVRPDLLYGHWPDDPLTPLLARRGKLADLSRCVQPVAADLPNQIRKSIIYDDRTLKKRLIFAAPFAQEVCNIHYWTDLVDESGLAGAPIPADWQGFWHFWHDVQNRLRRRGFDETYALALPMSPDTLDTFSIFECFLAAHSVAVVAPALRGDLLLTDADNPARLKDALEDYTSHYRRGFVPPGADAWKSDGNNQSFLGSLAVMTVNPTLSIPGAMTSDDLAYRVRLKSLPWPHTLQGVPLRPIVSLNQILLLRDSPNLAQARDFTAYFLRPEVTASYINGSQGRFVPVLSSLLDESPANSSSDPHAQMQEQMVKQGQPSLTTYHPAYSQVVRKNVWGEMIHAVATGRLTSSDAAQRAISRIQAIFKEWA